MWEKMDKELKQALAAMLVLLMIGCGVLLIPKGYATTKTVMSNTVPVAVKSGDKLARPTVIDKLDKLVSMQKAIEEGLVDVVDYDSMTEEEAQARGYASYTRSDGTRVWYAKHALNSLYAHDDGSLNEYAEGYFVAHSDTAYGQAIAGLYSGAVVSVDGREIVIDGYTYDNYNSGNLWEIRDRVGWDKVCFQTCVGGNGDVIIYYGHYTDGTPATSKGSGSSSNSSSSSSAPEPAAEKAAQEKALELAKQKAREEAARKAAEVEAQARAEAAAIAAAAQAQAQADAQAKEAAESQQADSQNSNSNSTSSSECESDVSGSSANANAA